jgi:hypothetical protein
MQLYQSGHKMHLTPLHVGVRQKRGLILEHMKNKQKNQTEEAILIDLILILIVFDLMGADLAILPLLMSTIPE